MKRLIMILVSCLIVSVLSMSNKPPLVHACSCALPPPIQEDLALKTAVFSGKVIDIDHPKSTGGLFPSTEAPVTITMETDTVWKGEVPKKVVVRTAMRSESCGYEGFAVGKDYLVWAHGDSIQSLETGRCERTKLLSTASQELAEMGAGYKPEPGGELDNTKKSYIDEPGASAWALYAGIVIILLVAGFMILKARKRSSS
ncbi:hypothetical protein ACFO9Q_13230 [Paenibacillus sp. GCM10023252]|uniref:hypothetical protein n=1 Tax=Paenibacillus sp. GCM10023252 TaxID=3252649 RepID=UPI003620208E